MAVYTRIGAEDGRLQTLPPEISNAARNDYNEHCHILLPL